MTGSEGRCYRRSQKIYISLAALDIPVIIRYNKIRKSERYRTDRSRRKHMNRMKLISIFKDTMQWIGEEPELQASVRASIAGTKLYYEDETPSLPALTEGQETVVTVTQHRSFEAGRLLRKVYPDARIAVHNFASATNPGGGVVHGCTAQEECLCRCSTLYPVLETQMDAYYQFHRKRRDVRYTDACIWSPEIRIIKTDTTEPQRMTDFCTVDVLTCAAPNLYPGNAMEPGKGHTIRMSDAELLALHQKRARHMLSIAAANGDEVLVLGAFGCGAFRNDPAVVAQAYHSILPEFQGYFRHIEFAVYCSSVDTRNYKEFKAQIG